MRTAGWKLVFVALIGLAASGCAEKLTYDRWDTIHVGQPKDGVRATLGSPSEDLGTEWYYRSEDLGIIARIWFQDDEVSGKWWQDAKHGIQGDDPNVQQPGEASEVKIKKVN